MKGMREPQDRREFLQQAAGFVTSNFLPDLQSPMVNLLLGNDAPVVPKESRRDDVKEILEWEKGYNAALHALQDADTSVLKAMYDRGMSPSAKPADVERLGAVIKILFDRKFLSAKILDSVLDFPGVRRIFWVHAEQKERQQKEEQIELDLSMRNRIIAELIQAVIEHKQSETTHSPSPAPSRAPASPLPPSASGPARGM